MIQFELVCLALIGLIWWYVDVNSKQSVLDIVIKRHLLWNAALNISSMEFDPIEYYWKWVELKLFYHLCCSPLKQLSQLFKGTMYTMLSYSRLDSSSQGKNRNVSLWYFNNFLIFQWWQVMFFIQYIFNVTRTGTIIFAPAEIKKIK